MISLPKKIILASSSPRRRDILEQMGIAFEIVPGSVDEAAYSCESPSELVCRLALMKAEAVADKTAQDVLVIGADTAVLKDRVLGKPGSREEAVQMLEYIQGGWHEVLTGIALVDKVSGYRSSRCECTQVEMMALSRDQIESYLDCGEYKDKAGGYAVQGLAAAFIPGIKGCYFNVVGLPVHLLYKELQRYKQVLTELS